MEALVAQTHWHLNARKCKSEREASGHIELSWDGTRKFFSPTKKEPDASTLATSSSSSSSVSSSAATTNDSLEFSIVDDPLRNWDKDCDTHIKFGCNGTIKKDGTMEFEVKDKSGQHKNTKMTGKATFGSINDGKWDCSGTYATNEGGSGTWTWGFFKPGYKFSAAELEQ